MVTPQSEPTILHADLDAFYASVEQMLDPSLRGRPVLVGGGIVVAASYEARAFGIRAPMPLRDALRLCPHAVVAGGHFDRYLELSERVMAILESASPVVEQISVDEAFLDVSGSVHLLGAPSEIARTLRHRVRAEIGLPLSIGIASTKFLAKIASARAKPDGLLVVGKGAELDFLHPLPVEAMWGVGQVTSARLRRLGVFTIGDLASISPAGLGPVLGPAASSGLVSLAWNRDPRPVRGGRRAGSVGSQQAMRATTDRDRMATVVVGIADRVGRRLRAKGRAGHRLTVRVRFPGPRSVTRSRKLEGPTASTAVLAEVANLLLDRALDVAAGNPVTLIGVSVSDLVSDDVLQLALLDQGSASDPGSATDLRRRSLDRAVDAVRERFGRDLMRLGTSGRGDDDFRRLWEKS
jgi:DNA polymerase IV